MSSPGDKLSENIWFVWSKTSYGGDIWKCHAWSRTDTRTDGHTCEYRAIILWNVNRIRNMLSYHIPESSMFNYHHQVLYLCIWYQLLAHSTNLLMLLASIYTLIPKKILQRPSRFMHFHQRSKWWIFLPMKRIYQFFFATFFHFHHSNNFHPLTWKVNQLSSSLTSVRSWPDGPRQYRGWWW